MWPVSWVLWGHKAWGSRRTKAEHWKASGHASDSFAMSLLDCPEGSNWSLANASVKTGCKIPLARVRCSLMCASFLSLPLSPPLPLPPYSSLPTSFFLPPPQKKPYKNKIENKTRQKSRGREDMGGGGKAVGEGSEWTKKFKLKKLKS